MGEKKHFHTRKCNFDRSPQHVFYNRSNESILGDALQAFPTEKKKKAPSENAALH